MNLTFTWQDSTDPHRRGYKYLRVNGISCGSVQRYEDYRTRSVRWDIGSTLPQVKFGMRSFGNESAAKVAVEAAVKKWFANFKQGESNEL